MTSRERIATILRRGVPDRIGIVDGFWPSTTLRWQREGMPAGVEPEDYFGTEIRLVDFDNSFQLPVETIEQTAEYRIVRDGNGMVAKNWLDVSSTPELFDFLIKTRADWDHYKERLAPNDCRVDWPTVEANYKKWRAEGQFVAFSALPGYEATWRRAGPENTLMAMATDGEWVREMCDADAALTVAVAQRLIDRGIEFDGAWLWDDLGYRNGLLYSRKTYVEQVMPAHRKIVEFFHAKGLPVILHSCGRVVDAVDLIVEAGFDCLQPMEAKAGMDVRDLKHRFGDRLAFMGNIDVRLMSGDPQALEAEIRDKFAVAKEGGGYIYHSDHSVPHTVSLDQYRTVLEIVRKYAWY